MRNFRPAAGLCMRNGKRQSSDTISTQDLKPSRLNPQVSRSTTDLFPSRSPDNRYPMHRSLSDRYQILPNLYPQAPLTPQLVSFIVPAPFSPFSLNHPHIPENDISLLNSNANKHQTTTSASERRLSSPIAMTASKIN